MVERAGESLSVELKRWIDPDQPEGIAKIVKAALALRNHGGGASSLVLIMNIPAGFGKRTPRCSYTISYR
jgi:hypothetical protein